MPGLAEALVGPGPAAVDGLVNAVAERDRVPAGRLPRPDPDDVRIRLGDGEVADRNGRLLVEHGHPGRSGVLRLPDAARTDGRVDDPGPGFDRLDVGRPSAGQGRADRSPGERPEKLFHRGGRLGRGRGHGQGEEKAGQPRRPRGADALNHHGILLRVTLSSFFSY